MTLNILMLSKWDSSTTLLAEENTALFSYDSRQFQGVFPFMLS